MSDRINWGKGPRPDQDLTELLNNSSDGTSVALACEKLEHAATLRLSGEQQKNYIEALKDASEKIQKPFDDLKNEVLDSIKNIDIQKKLIRTRKSELNTIIKDLREKGEAHAGTIPVCFKDQNKKELAFAIAWVEKRNKLTKKFADSASHLNMKMINGELRPDPTHPATHSSRGRSWYETKRKLRYHNNIGIKEGILAENKEGGLDLTKLGNMAENWINTQIDTKYIDWRQQNEKIYNHYFNRVHELSYLRVRRKALNSLKKKLGEYDQALEKCQNPQSKRFFELKKEITEPIKLAERFCKTLPAALKASSIVEAAGGPLKSEGEEEESFGLPQLGSDNPALHAQIEAINDDLKQLRVLEKGLSANPNSRDIKKEYTNLLASLKDSFDRLTKSIRTYEEARTLILLRQNQNFGNFYQRYHALRDAIFTPAQRFFMTRALKKVPTSADLNALTDKCTLMVFNSNRELEAIKGKDGQPLTVSNAVFLKVLTKFQDTVKITHKGNKIQYLFSSTEDLKQFVNMCREESIKEQEKNQDKKEDKPDDYTVTEADPEQVKKQQKQQPEEQRQKQQEGTPTTTDVRVAEAGHEPQRMKM